MPALATVLFGRLRDLAELPVEGPVPLPGATVVARTDRGVELARVLAAREGDAPAGPRAVLRIATGEDLARAARLRERDEGEGKGLAVEAAERLGLAVKVVALETLLEGERTFLHYWARDRADVRGLAQALERALGTGVELRQLGARERARACGGAGPCGLSLCCSTFLRALLPVSPGLARLQGTPLTPERALGACGRLRCCLRYEAAAYEEGRARLPALGSVVEARPGKGTVVALDPLRGRAILETVEGRRLRVLAGDVRSVEPPPEPPPVADPGRTASGRWRAIGRLFGLGADGPPAL